MSNACTSLFAETLRPRFFAELGLSRQRLLQWFEITGVEPERPDGAVRRLFSPAHVLRLAILKDLKEPASVSFNEQADLIALLRTDEFVARAFDLWRSALGPVLVTDLGQMHELKPASAIEPEALLATTRQLHLYGLAPSVGYMLTAMLRGGVPQQRDYAAQATADHAEAVRLKRASRHVEIYDKVPPHTEQQALVYAQQETVPEAQRLHARWR